MVIHHDRRQRWIFLTVYVVYHSAVSTTFPQRDCRELMSEGVASAIEERKALLAVYKEGFRNNADNSAVAKLLFKNMVKVRKEIEQLEDNVDCLPGDDVLVPVLGSKRTREGEEADTAVRRLVTGLTETASDYDSLLGLAATIATHDRYREADAPCVRPRHISPTWMKDAWFRNLLVARAKLRRPTSDCGPRVMGFWTSPGNGNSHWLSELEHFCATDGGGMAKAADPSGKKELGNVDCYVYISYGMGQKLKFDRSDSDKAVYWRLLMSDLVMTNRGCDKFFQMYSRVLLEDVSEYKLRDLLVHHFVAKKVNHVAVAIDDVLSLLRGQESASHGPIPIVTSRVAYLVEALEKQGVSCTAVVAPLSSTFFSPSGINGKIVTVELPSMSGAVDWLIEQQHLSGDRLTAENLALVRAVGGAHFRSAVVALQQLADDKSPTLQSVFEEVLRLQEAPMAAENAGRLLVKNYIVASLRDGEQRRTPERYIEPFTAVAPVFVWAAFEKEDNCPPSGHPAQKLVQMSSSLATARGQVSHCGMLYDHFRALCELPVVPCDADLRSDTNEELLGLLLVPREVAVKSPSVGSIFLVNHDGTVYVADGWQPSPEQYMLPSDRNHPWIDRACVAFGPADEACLVIYKDNITVNGFPEALHHLGCAATCLREFLVGYDVLCVAQVAHTSSVVLDVSDFHDPLVLVRQQEFALYYGKTFAVPISSAINRNQPETDG